MCRLFETLKISQKQICHLKFHNQRMNYARRELLKETTPLNIEENIVFPLDLTDAVYKLRVFYSRVIEKYDFSLYQKREIKSLRLVKTDSINYAHKFEDRKVLNLLLELRGESDDVLIVKGDKITDTSFSNVVFWDGAQWLTPKEPLLKGTCRERLIQNGVVFEREIRVKDLRNFKKCSLVNAMLDLGESEIDISNILI